MISILDEDGGTKEAAKQKYPREDKCQTCGKYLGTILSAEGEMVALGDCGEHKKKEVND